VLVLLVAAYASLYVCRANVEPGLNLLAVRYGYDNERTGVVFAIALAAYAVGKVVLGAVGDVVGGKRILLFAMVGSILSTLLIGAVAWPEVVGANAALWVIGAFVVANRFAQSGGWGGIVHVVSRWFPPERAGTVMGVASTSFDVGNVAALLLCAWLVSKGFGWRALFLVNPAVLGVVTVVVALTLRGSPGPLRAEVRADEANAADDEEPREPMRAVLAKLARSRPFWIAVVLSFVLTFVRAAFMTWTPRYLYEVSIAAGTESALSSSIAKSAFFGVAGMTGSLVVGRLSDRWGPGKRAGVMTLSLALLLVAVLVLAHAGVKDPLYAALLIGVAGLFLLGPYSLPAGAIALDVAGKRGASTTVGVVDGVGYLGASLAAVVLGSVSKRSGWSAAFDVIAGVSAVALVIAALWWRSARPRP